MLLLQLRLVQVLTIEKGGELKLPFKNEVDSIKSKMVVDQLSSSCSKVDDIGDNLESIHSWNQMVSMVQDNVDNVLRSKSS